MPRLYILCPVMGRPIETDYSFPDDADLEEFKDMKTYCEYCSEYHNWNASDAFFIEKGPPLKKKP